jgi:hypothetical protein
MQLKSATGAVQVLKPDASPLGMSTPVLRRFVAKISQIIESGKGKSSKPHRNILSRIPCAGQEIIVKKSTLIFGNGEILKCLMTY